MSLDNQKQLKMINRIPSKIIDNLVINKRVIYINFKNIKNIKY